MLIYLCVFVLLIHKVSVYMYIYIYILHKSRTYLMALHGELFDMLRVCPDVTAVGESHTARQSTWFGQHCCTKPGHSCCSCLPHIDKTDM